MSNNRNMRKTRRDTNRQENPESHIQIIVLNQILIIHIRIPTHIHIHPQDRHLTQEAILALDIVTLIRIAILTPVLIRLANQIPPATAPMATATILTPGEHGNSQMNKFA